MKRVTILALIITLCYPFVRGQQPSKEKGLLSFNISLTDYSFLKTISDSSVNKAFQQRDWLKPGKKSFGLGLSIWKGITEHIGFSATIAGTLSSFPAYFVKRDSVGQAKFSIQTDALLHFKLLDDKALINPFLTAGIGAGYFPNQFAAYAPLGAGLQFHFNDGALIIVQAQWRKALTSGISSDYLQYSLSLAQMNKNTIAKAASKKDKHTAQASLPLIKDSDGDGIPDATDSCPLQKGTLFGCPDSDGDGVADKDDQCKDVPGVARYHGCPVPDTDNDGINDEDDKCPLVPGVRENFGCPILTGNKDTILNDTTRYLIYFEPGKSILQSEGFDVLGKVVQQLKANKKLVAICMGHTDNSGSVSANYSRSASRAAVCTDYITSFYINKDRVSSMSLGNTLPAADLNDPLLQWKNRRVEIVVFEKK